MGARGVGLLHGFLPVGDLPSLGLTDDPGHVRERDDLRTRHVVGALRVGRRVAQDRHGRLRHVLPGDRAHAAVACWAAHHTVLVHYPGEEIQVERVAQEGPRHSRFANVLLGVPVVAGQGEGGIRGGRQEGRVDDVPDPRGGSGFHEDLMLMHPVRVLPGGNHEEHVDPGQCLAGSLRVAVFHHGHVPFEPGYPAGVAHQQSQLRCQILQAHRDSPAELPRDPCDGDCRFLSGHRGLLSDPIMPCGVSHRRLRHRCGGAERRTTEAALSKLRYI